MGGGGEPLRLVARFWKRAGLHLLETRLSADQVAEDYGRWFGARLRRVEAGLEGRDWLCADRFTGADISVGFALLLADFLGSAPRFGPNVTAYWQRLQARPGFQAAKRAQGSSLAELLAP